MGTPRKGGGDGDVQGLTGPPDRHRRTIPAEAYVDGSHDDVSLLIDPIPNLFLVFP